MVTLKAAHAVEILDSRGNPTVETSIVLSDGTEVCASVPSGASIGIHEAVELRDNDEKRFGGMGVLNAVSNVNDIISPKLRGMDIVKQGAIDEAMIELDGTENKSKLGANAILSVSLAVCRAAAKVVNKPLYEYINDLIHASFPTKMGHIPTPTFNVINGGKHGAGNLDFQEFHIIPASIKPFHEALRLGVEIYQELKEVLVKRNAVHSVGDEGGYAPNLYTNIDALEAIMEAIRTTKYKFGFDVFLGLDLAPSFFKHEETYQIKDRPTSLTAAEFIEYLVDLHHNYNLLVLEDPLGEDDWKDWKIITEKIGKEVHIVGDDFLVTNAERLKKAIAEKACSAIIIKPNQAGSLSETLKVIKIAKEGNFKTIVSHRSGETTDDFISDLAVGVAADYVKFGAPARGERVAKYNRLLHIQRELNISS